jgi:uncharacterized protein (TIGR03086 family)
MTTMELYRRAQDCFDAVVAEVPSQQWDAPSMCPEWTVRDVVGHIVWGQEQLRHWATGLEYADSSGAPGAAHPGPLAGVDPVKTWRAAREASVASLTSEGLARVITLPGLGEVPVAAMVNVWVTDQLAHSWDIGHALGLEVKLDDDLVAASFASMRQHILRAPGYFGPELTPPQDAGEQTRWLAFLGRAAWQRQPPADQPAAETL